MKSRSPGFISGQHWNACDRCGFAYRERDLRKEWSGAVVCIKCWEPKHPQLAVRGVKDDTSPQGLHRSEPTDTFKPVTFCLTTNAEAGVAEAGCAQAGSTELIITDPGIPAGTFVTPS